MSQRIDLGMVALTGLLTIGSLWRSFDSLYFLVAGGIGLGLGVLLAILAYRLRQPAVVLATLAVVAFFLLGGAVALSGQGGMAWLPLPDTLKQLARLSVFGWKEFLTTLPPVDGRGPFLVLPYLLGLVYGVVGSALALKSRGALAVVVPAASLFAVAILIGVFDPRGLLIQGAVSGLLILGWASWRARQGSGVRLAGGSVGNFQRGVVAVLLVTGATTVAAPLTSFLMPDGDRVVLRSKVEPPFDIGLYPSPLSTFRVFTKPEGPEPPPTNVYDKPIVSVKGLAEGTRVRFAVMDQYDGSVWGATSEAGLTLGPLPNVFQRVNSTIDNPSVSKGAKPVTATFTLEEGFKALGVWLPTAGAVTHVHFQGPGADQAQETFRYNLATNAGVVPSGLRKGDRITMSAVIPDDTPLTPDMGVGDSFTGYTPPAFVAGPAQAWTADQDAGTPADRVLAAASRLKSTGRYTDGTGGFSFYTAGHYNRRLTEFFSAEPQMAGDDEQFAAAMALLGNQLGLPSRVVLGAELPADGVIKGKDVHAWIEAQGADGSWRVLPTTDFMDPSRLPDKNPARPQPERAGINVPPPAPIAPKTDTGDPFADDNKLIKKKATDGVPPWIWSVVKYVVLPLAFLALLVEGVLFAKRRRRKRRMSAARMEARFVGGWLQLLDTARDYGWKGAKPSATRPEQAHALALPGAVATAVSTDVAVFGVESPSDEEAAEFWKLISSLEQDIRKDQSRWRRLRANLNPVTLIPGGGRSPRALVAKARRRGISKPGVRQGRQPGERGYRLSRIRGRSS